jgi:hypothetical protein
MGFIIQYNRFFSVSMMENGLDKPIGEFSFFAVSETLRTLRNHNLLFRPSNSGFEVYYCSTPLIPITEKVRFTIGFRYSNNSLYEKYGLTKTDSSDLLVYEPALCFDNLTPDGSIITEQGASLAASGAEPDEHVAVQDTGRIYSQTFTLVQVANEAVPENYILKHRYQPSPEQTVPVNIADDAQTVQTIINSADRDGDYMSEPGPYTLKTSSPESAQNIYLHNELAGRSARGVVDIYWESTQNSVAEDTGQQYYITFKPK